MTDEHLLKPAHPVGIVGYGAYVPLSWGMWTVRRGILMRCTGK